MRLLDPSPSPQRVVWRPRLRRPSRSESSVNASHEMVANSIPFHRGRALPNYQSDRARYNLAQQTSMATGVEYDRQSQNWTPAALVAASYEVASDLSYRRELRQSQEEPQASKMLLAVQGRRNVASEVVLHLTVRSEVIIKVENQTYSFR